MGGTKILAGLAALCSLSGCSGSRLITIGCKNFTEQIVLGEIAAQQIENRLHVQVDRRFNLGGTLVTHAAIKDKDIDLYPEYTGTAYSSILKQREPGSPEQILQRVRDGYKPLGLVWMDPLGFNNSFAMVIRGADARSRHLETLSDAAKDAQGFTLGTGYEFASRPDGLPALDRTYKIHWSASTRTMDLGLLYSALQQNKISMAAGNMTDGILSVIDAKVLADDRHVFPAYQACYVVRAEAFNTYPHLQEALAGLSGKLTDERMRQLNYQIDGKHRGVREVAGEFLQGAGLR